MPSVAAQRWARKLAEGRVFPSDPKRKLLPEEIRPDDRWCPDPDDSACEWPETICPWLELPCSRCPHHREQY